MTLVCIKARSPSTWVVRVRAKSGHNNRRTIKWLAGSSGDDDLDVIIEIVELYQIFFGKTGPCLLLPFFTLVSHTASSTMEGLDVDDLLHWRFWNMNAEILS